MKVTMTEAICKEGMALLEDKARIFVAHDAHPHNYLDQLKDTDMFIVRWRTRERLTRRPWRAARL